MTRRAALILATTLTAGALACSVKVPATTTWTIPAGDRAPRWSEDGPAIGVLDVGASPDVLSTSIAWRTSEGRAIHRHPTATWTDYPDRLVERLLRARLAASGAFSAVREAPPRSGLDATLDCTLEDFSEWDGPGTGEARVRLRCSLRDANGEAVGAPFEATGVEPTGAVSVRGIAAAIGEAASQATDAVVTGTTERLAAR